MSGSPKYSAADIAVNVVEQISAAVEQYRAAEAERSRLRAEDERWQRVVSTRTAL